MDPITYKRADVVTTATDGTRYILDVRTMGSVRPSAQEIRTAEAAKHKEYHTDSACWGASTFVPLVHPAFGPMGPSVAKWLLTLMPQVAMQANQQGTQSWGKSVHITRARCLSSLRSCLGQH